MSEQANMPPGLAMAKAPEVVEIVQVSTPPKRAKKVKRRAGTPDRKQTTKPVAAQSLTAIMEEGDGEADLCRVPTSEILTDIPEFVFADLPLARMFEARTLAQKLKIKFPFWVDQAAMVVAVMSMAHQEPTLPTNPALFYAKLADSNKVENKALFAVLFNAVQKAFPHLLNLGGEVEDAKND